jgi:adenine-specific DNA-methyltransferase
MSNTSNIIQSLWKDEFSFGVAIDDFEFVNLATFFDSMFPQYERNIVVVNHHPQGAGGRLSRTHEYFILISPSTAPAFLGEPQEDYQEDRSFMRSGTAENNFRYGRWKSFYALLLDSKTNKIVGAEDPVPLDQPYPLENTKDGLVRIYPINSKGEERVWRASYLTGRERAINEELIVTDGGTIYQTIDHEDKREVLFSNWTDSKFNSGNHGSNVLRDLGLGSKFDYPKSIFTLETALWAQTFGKKDALIFDYFAGSGTTGHAVINLNRTDSGNRKYILVEMGAHFDTATKPRIQKAIYSEDWKDGKPISRKGSSHCFKYLRLESYEDTLNNLVLQRTQEQQLSLDQSSSFSESYMLSYMLDSESQQALLNVAAFAHPFAYQLNIATGTVGESKPTNIDLVETFNYLIGLRVQTMQTLRGYKVITGLTPDGERTLIIWRDLSEKSNADLEEFFRKQDYNPRDMEFDLIYVNGDNNLENLRRSDETWKVRLIEEEFLRRMFDNEGL